MSGKKGLLRPDHLHQRYDPEDLHRITHGRELAALRKNDSAKAA
jgi:hypothetical protein